ncbi:MAG TPA: hypothetical protein VN373_00470 [Methanosarcina barkeri]|nr:hypothetical protein [Methanosarcina barkeri]
MQLSLGLLNTRQGLPEGRLMGFNAANKYCKEVEKISGKPEERIALCIFTV